MARKKIFMVLDTETATLPFANEIANGDAEKKKKIAIAKPLIYDIGWTICDRQGNIYERKQFLIAEIFAVPQIFNTAYYANKRPIYLEMLRNGETTIRPWHDVMNEFIGDLDKVDAVGAFNSMFDFKKAIPFTELYINNLYSPNYQNWEKMQYSFCEKLVAAPSKKERNPDFEEKIFRFRGEAYPLFDLWGLAVSHLLNNVSYKKECLNHGLLTSSGLYFKTSAESTYQYICNKYEFVESHTALDDAEIETFILSKIANRHAINPGIEFFPFRTLGTTDNFCRRKKTPDYKECKIVYDAIKTYLETKEEGTAYYTQMFNRLAALEEIMSH